MTGKVFDVKLSSLLCHRRANALVIGILSCVITVLLTGCATVPTWTKGVGNESPYYHEGTGLGHSSAELAKRYAFLDLVAQANGIEMKEELKDLQTSTSLLKNGRYETTQENTWNAYVTTRLHGKVEAGAKVVEVFEKDGIYSAYAIARKRGVDRLLNNEFNQRIYGYKLRSLVPGWAQLQKNDDQKAKRFISIAVGSSVSWLVSHMLQSEFETRRSISSTNEDYDFYDKLAHRTYWFHVGSVMVFSANYLYSTLDGLFTPPLPYKVLLGYQRRREDADPNGRLMLSLRF